MHISPFLGLVALPLAAAVPYHAPREVHEKRITLKQNAQFDFKPFVLTDVGMDCDRQSADDMFACEIRCKQHLPSLQWSRPSTNRTQSTGMTPTRSGRTMCRPAPVLPNGRGMARRVRAVIRTPTSLSSSCASSRLPLISR